jgi:hypothetical protein
MVKNSGDTQARFLAKEPGLFSIQQLPRNLDRKGREGRKESLGTGFP